MARLILFVLIFSAFSGLSQITESVFFASDDHLLTQYEKEKLTTMVQKTGDMPNAVIYITGHTDSDGTDDYNAALSFNRSRSVYNFFIDHGAKPSNIKMSWKGENSPLANNSEETGKAANRRVEIVVDENNHVKNFDAEKSILDLVNTDNAETQLFLEYGDMEIRIKGKHGTGITIPAGALLDENGNEYKGDVEIRLKEFYQVQDMVMAGLQTTSSGQIIETEGMFHVEVTGNGIPLHLKPGYNAQISMTAENAYPDMQVFYGSGANGSVDWVLKEKQKEVIKIKELSVNEKIIGVTDTSMGKGFMLNVTGIGETEDLVRVEKSYNFEIDGFGWINCDRFKDYPSKKGVLVSVDGAGDFNVFALLKNSKSIIKASWLQNGRVYKFSELPDGEPLVIMAMKYDGEKIQGCVYPFTVGSMDIQYLSPGNFSQQEFSDKLSQIQ